MYIYIYIHICSQQLKKKTGEIFEGRSGMLNLGETYSQAHFFRRRRRRRQVAVVVKMVTMMMMIMIMGIMNYYYY